MNCIYCQEPIRKARNASGTADLYLDTRSFANCSKTRSDGLHTGPHAPAPPVAEEHPHTIERRRLEDIIGANLLPEPNTPPYTQEKARLRLYVLNSLITLASNVSQLDDSYCYMTACDLIEELLLMGQKGKAK